MNKEEKREYNSNYYHANKERLDAQRKPSRQRYYQRNIEIIRAKQKKYYENKRKERIETSKRYYYNNRERLKKSQLEYYHEHKNKS
jgi:hypothetical protein